MYENSRFLKNRFTFCGVNTNFGQQWAPPAYYHLTPIVNKGKLCTPYISVCFCVNGLLKLSNIRSAPGQKQVLCKTISCLYNITSDTLCETVNRQILVRERKFNKNNCFDAQSNLQQSFLNVRDPLYTGFMGSIHYPKLAEIRWYYMKNND